MENHELFFIFEHMVCSLLLLACFFYHIFVINKRKRKKKLIYHAIPSKAHITEMSIFFIVNMRTTLNVLNCHCTLGYISHKISSPMFLH